MAQFRMKIASVTAEVTSMFGSTPNYFRPYLTEDTPAFAVTVREEDLRFEQAQLDQEAEEEGFHALAAQFRGVAAIEKSHEERYRALLNNVETKAVFEKSGIVMWECRNCGHLVLSAAAPEVCPVCAHPKAYFEVHKENY